MPSMRDKTQEKLLAHIKTKLDPKKLEGMNEAQVDRFLDDIAYIMVNQVMKSMTSTWANLTAMVEGAPVRPIPFAPGESVQTYIGKDRKHLAEMLGSYWTKLQHEMSNMEDVNDAPGIIKEFKGEPEAERKRADNEGGNILDFAALKSGRETVN